MPLPGACGTREPGDPGPGATPANFPGLPTPSGPRPRLGPGGHPGGGIRVLSRLTDTPSPSQGESSGALPRGLRVLVGWRPAEQASCSPHPPPPLHGMVVVLRVRGGEAEPPPSP